ncbi:MAG: hypothetical protein ACREMN_00265 [Gemmatimonadales bacterium]
MTASTYEPRRPGLVATALCTLWVGILSLPMLAGRFLAGPFSDQITAGLPFRGWGAEWWRRLGHVPLWNPEIFGGMPYVGALGTGDVLYPTAFLRLILPTATVINLGFFAHYVLAGVFMYLFLRRLPVSWGGAVTGALAYQLSGLVASYVQPGHDGKLVVTALMPLVLLGLLIGMRDRQLWGYSLTALGVGLGILTQHVQLTYYLLLTTGLFALYLTFGSGSPAARDRIARLGLALGAVLLGFAIAGPQLLPAFVHMPLSARAAGVGGGFAGATSYAIPWDHVPEFFLKNFVGWGALGTYWGSNPLKLHSEYLGLPVVALAVLGAGAGQDRRLRLWLGGIGALFLLISLGSATPFYRLWWAVMPYVKQMRAPGMAFFVVAFVVACFAAFGVERLETTAQDGKPRRHVNGWLIAAGVIALLGLAGVFGRIAESLGAGRSPDTGAIAVGAVTSAIALAAVAGLAWLALRGRLSSARWIPAALVVIGTDLWFNARPFWTYSDAHRDMARSDAMIDRIKAGGMPTRVLELGALLGQPVYDGSALMARSIPQVLGQHGLEIRYFVNVLGGRGEWRNLGNIQLWDLLAVRWVIAPASVGGLDSIPGFTQVLSGVTSVNGTPANLFERREPVPYARVVPAAVSLDSAQLLATVTDPRMAYDRIVLLDSRAGILTPPLTALPATSRSRATVETWEPGRMVITLDPPPEAAAYVLVAENWYPDWQARVDGLAARVLRGDWTLITVPVGAGARRIELTYRSTAFTIGKVISWLALVVVAASFVWPVLARRRPRV